MMCGTKQWTKLPLCLTLLVVLGLGLLLSRSFAQSSARDKPRLKDFGSSLKKLKWDPLKNETSDSTSRTQNQNTDLDVVQIDTTLVACDLLVVDKQGRTVQGLQASDFA